MVSLICLDLFPSIVFLEKLKKEKKTSHCKNRLSQYSLIIIMITKSGITITFPIMSIHFMYYHIGFITFARLRNTKETKVFFAIMSSVTLFPLRNINGKVF